MKTHLLFPNGDFDFSADPGPLYADVERDLELAFVLRAMAEGDRFLLDVSRRVILASVDDVAGVLYRQAVLADCIEHEELVRNLYALVIAALDEKRGVWSFRTSSPVILHGAVAQLEAFVVRLHALRQLADDNVDQVHSEGLRNLFGSIRADLDEAYFQALRRHLRQLQFKSGVLLSARLDRDNSGTDYVLRSPGAVRQGWRERVGLAPRTSYSFTIPPRDEGALNALSDLESRGLNHVANAAAQAADHIESYFTILRAELAFYVSCLNLRKSLVAREVPVVFPLVLPHGTARFSCSDLRDVALALQTLDQVVGNDADADDRPLVVVTGANSGGKTTFLRSVGLAQLMAQCGMFVAASSFRASLHSSVFTHFAREEDASMRSGRLDDELRRMDAIADAMTRYALVLFNESFSGTNEREGSEIGRQVVQALLERDATVVFVTHQYDLAESFRRTRSSTTRFLRADRAPDGRPTYRLLSGDPLPTSFAGDVYRRIGGFGEVPSHGGANERGDALVNGVAEDAGGSELASGRTSRAGPEGSQP